MSHKKSMEHQRDLEAFQLPSDLAHALREYKESIWEDAPDDAAFAAMTEELLQLPQMPSKQPLWPLPFWQLSGLASAFAAVLFLLLPTPQRSVPLDQHKRTTQQTGSRTPSLSLAMIPKGALSVQLFAISRKTQYKQKILVRDREQLYNGDQIQFVLQASPQRPCHIAILSINQRGEVALYHPASGSQSHVLDAGKRRQLAPLELDDYVGLERIYVLLSDAPFALKAAKQALRRAHQRSSKDLRRPLATIGTWRIAWTRLLHKPNMLQKR